MYDLSVIVPVYNLEPYLPKFLNSLERQDLADYRVEYIFVDNNSTDESKTLLNRSILKNKKILDCEKQGVGNARNVGLKEAQGKYIWFMDGDDWLTEPVAIRMALDKALSREYDIILIPFKSPKYKCENYSMVWQYVIRKDLLKDIWFPNYQPCEDSAFMNKVFERTKWASNHYRQMPQVSIALYCYNYLREGSNLYRYLVLNERI